MSKTLVLKPRIRRGETYMWHDLFVLQTAINHIAAGKSISKIGIWLNIAGKLQYKQEENDLGPKSLDQVIEIELRNVEAKLLCKELTKLNAEQFGQDMQGQPLAPSLGILSNMLVDFGSQLGHSIVDIEGDDDDD